VQHTLGGAMTGISTEYHASPLNGPDLSAGKAGRRVAPVTGEPPYGAGPDPHFTLCSDAAPDPTTLAKFATVLDPVVRPAINGVGIALVRPDGYLALATFDGDWGMVDRYLSRFTPTDVSR
jgi:hypothetical protein